MAFSFEFFAYNTVESRIYETARLDLAYCFETIVYCVSVSYKVVSFMRVSSVLFHSLQDENTQTNSQSKTGQTYIMTHLCKQ